MSVFMIYYENGAKKMRPVLSEQEYRNVRDSDYNRRTDKKHMVQMNYSCLPNDDGSLKGTTRVSRSVGMDIDFNPSSADYEQKMASVPDLILSKKDELGLLMLERSANKGYHIAFSRKPELSQEENLKWAAELLGVEYDKGAKDITRVFFTPPTSHMLFLDNALFDNREAENSGGNGKENISDNSVADNKLRATEKADENSAKPVADNSSVAQEAEYCGVPYSSIIKKWWEMYNDGEEPVRSNRNTLTFELAVNLRHICGFDRRMLDEVIPCYDGFSEAEKLSCIDSALSEKKTQMPKRLKDVLTVVRQERRAHSSATGEGRDALGEALDEASTQDELYYYNALPKMPQGVKDSIDAVGPALSMPTIIAICPAIGMLATGVKVEVHGKMSRLNLISYIAGDFASGKGSIDPVVEAWTGEVKAMDRLYQQQEDEWRAKKRAAKNKKEQPEEPKLPVRCLTLNNTVANLAERLANTEGKHAFSFTPEADTVAQKWKSAMSDFSVMLRQAYDGSPYEREARSAEAVNVHISQLLWNVVMAGTPDALYRVVSNYTDGFQSRIAVGRTPDNTFSPLGANLFVLTERQAEHIRQIAHLLPLMEGEVRLEKMEKKGREWLERIRLETMEDDDRIRARQRFRICPTTMRMTTCIMLCRVAELLISKHGPQGAETRLKQDPNLWKELIVKAQTAQMLSVFDTLADYLLENALYFFRNRIEAAFSSNDYAATSTGRVKRGKNDSIFARLPDSFTFEQAMHQSVAVKGQGVTQMAARQMTKNWEKQGLVKKMPDGRFQKMGLKGL